jgi:choline dehydrogenase-like flavoprotein
MEVDVAVLGGGPGGYTAAIRAAQLGARVACIEREPELGGTCLRIGCIPTKAWVQTAFALKQAEETFGKLGVTLDGPKFEFPVANEWKAAAVRRMTRGAAQQEPRMHQPAARHSQIGFRRVKLPVGFCQRARLTSEDGSLVEQPGPADPLIHAADRLPHPGLADPAHPQHDRRSRSGCLNRLR